MPNVNICYVRKKDGGVGLDLEVHAGSISADDSSSRHKCLSRAYIEVQTAQDVEEMAGPRLVGDD